MISIHVPMAKSWKQASLDLSSTSVVWITNAIITSFLLITRSMGRILPLPILWCLLWPLAFLRSFWELGYGGPTLKNFRAMGDWLGKRSTFLRILAARSRLNL